MKFKERTPNSFKISSVHTIDHDIKRRRYKKLLETAISSWSGYVYQGKVAIYHVLKKIDNTGYELQLDSLDDFAILDESGKVIFLHQVKAKKSHNFSAYKKAFSQLEVGGNIIECEELYFHLAQRITDKTVTDIEAQFPSIKVYEYNDDTYCNVDQIDSEIEHLIMGKMVEAFPEDHSKTSQDYLIKVRRYLDDIVVKKLLEIHQIIHNNLQTETEAAFTQTIAFSEFIDILDKDLNQEEVGEDYYLYLLRSDICQYYQEYCLENEDELNENDLERLNVMMCNFEQLSKYEIIQFICNIIPQRTFKFNTIKDYGSDGPYKSEIKNVFLHIMHSIKKECTYTENNLLQWIAGEALFSPTCITEGTNPRNIERVCHEIVKNVLDRDLNILFESDKLITDTLEVDSIVSPTLIERCYENEQNHIMKWKKVSLMSLENAKKEIDV